MKLFNSSRELCYAEIIIMKLKASLLLNVSLHICPLTFITKELHLVATFVCS